MICQETKCEDYMADDGEPTWCYRAGRPAEVAVKKCPKVNEEQTEQAGNDKAGK